MIRKMSHITLLVEDQETALDFFTEKLGFVKWDDDAIGEGHRWLVVAPKGQSDIGLVLLRADTEEKRNAIGNQAGGHVLMVLQTNDIKKTFGDMKGKGVEFEGNPQERAWGTEVVFKDLHGNRFELLQPKGWS
jgi:catechol 2,3-dioxygenase-like lactoylglutathione lyase family enzyme